MNWQTKTEEELENLPSRERNHDYSWENDSYWGKGLPYARINRWIESQDGVNIDSVIHKFVNLKWLLPEYRTLEQLRKHIEFNTFAQDGKIFYYSPCRWNHNFATEIEKEGLKLVYINPLTRCVSIHHPPTHKSWKKRNQLELDKKLRILGDYHQLYKEDGIWYEVKGEVFNPTAAFLHLYPRKNPKDILLESGETWFERNRAAKPCVKITLKRQLNKKELKKHGLSNDLK